MNWVDVSAWANDRLAQSRLKNDGDLDQLRTAHLRGQIDVLKELLDLPKQREVLVAQAKSFSPE